MTRETKIGLLVGLAFIIVIGILLSEHVSSTNEPQQAPLNTAGTNVRDGVVTPGTGDGPPVTIAGVPADAPHQLVPTRTDLRAAAPPPVAYIQIGGAGHAPPARRPSPTGIPTADSSSAITPAPNPTAPNLTARGAESNGGGSMGPSGTLAAVTPASNLPRGARELLLQNPDDLVPVNSNGSSPPTSGTERFMTYTAAAGDSVSRIAGRIMGGNTKSNRDLLVRANPSLQNEGNVVVIGRMYFIPKVSTSAAGIDPIGAPSSLGISTPSRNAAEALAKPPRQTRWYTVKSDDNLWKIAQSELGSGTAWSLIRDLNKDALKGGETVHANMRLRLPAKTALAGAE